MSLAKRVRSEDDNLKTYPILSCHNGKHLSQHIKDDLLRVANHLASKGKGITACDESSGTIGTRFAAVGVENTDENRRQYRQMLFETPGINAYLCGAILDPETLLQKSLPSNEYFPKVLSSLDIIPGVKPHLKTYTLPGTGGDTVMQGLDSLAVRLKEYYQQGARFTKWRSPLEINVLEGRPTQLVIESNMRDLARFALISQSEGLVPLVEPDVVLTGDHNLEMAVAINTEIASMLYHNMLKHGVFMEGCILKVNMVNPGQSCAKKYSVNEIAQTNVDVLRRTMPAAIPGVNYLSGGQCLSDACARLSAINQIANTVACPWNISFSWSAAIQMPLFELCRNGRGLTADVLADMSKLYLEELAMASKASLGKYVINGDSGAHRGANENSGNNE